MTSPKRFYTDVAVEPGEGGFGLLLDGKAVRTPARAPLVIPAARLAQAVADEWRAQGEHIEPATMPLTQHVNAGIDRIAPNREAVLDELVRYAETDQCCYRADEPELLIARQAQVWDPLLGWAHGAHGLEFAVTSGIMPAAQPAETIARARAALEPMDPCALSALHTVTAISGSLVMGLAARDFHLDADALFEAALVDELFQVEQWGADEEAEERRHHLKEGLGSACAVFSLLKSDA